MLADLIGNGAARVGKLATRVSRRKLGTCFKYVISSQQVELPCHSIKG